MTTLNWYTLDPGVRAVLHDLASARRTAAWERLLRASRRRRAAA